MCAGIHMSDIPSFPYEILWGERQIRSVANLTRADGAGVPAAGDARPASEAQVTPIRWRGERGLDDLAPALRGR